MLNANHQNQNMEDVNPIDKIIEALLRMKMHRECPELEEMTGILMDKGLNFSDSMLAIMEILELLKKKAEESLHAEEGEQD